VPRLSAGRIAAAVTLAALFAAGLGAGLLAGDGDDAPGVQPAGLRRAAAPATAPLPAIAAEGSLPALRSAPPSSTGSAAGSADTTSHGGGTGGSGTGGSGAGTAITPPPSSPPPPPNPPTPPPPNPPDGSCGPDGC
jgi:hypothetical protein